MRTISYLDETTTGYGTALASVGGRLLPRARWTPWRSLPVVRQVTLYHPVLPPEFDGLRIVQVSDVHAGTFMPVRRLHRVSRVAEVLKPDLILFTGDQLDRRETDADIFVQGFAGIDAPLGVYGILGNHDHVAGPDLAVAAMDAAGIVPLVNESATLEREGVRLLLAGVDDPDGRWDGPDFGVLWRTPAEFRVLLSHQPKTWREGLVAGAHVTLAGHTHGGQIALRAGNVSVARLGTPFIAGPYLSGDDLLYVSRGVGVGAFPIRYGAPPEIDLITLRRGAAAAV